MKLPFKAAVILGIFAILISTAYAQTATEVKLTEVSGNGIDYYCFDCNPNPEGQEGNIVWYGCDKTSYNCQVSVRSESSGREIATLRFNKAKVYFQNKKLSYILVDPFYTHPNAVPFKLAGIEIPYVSAGDRINFQRANLVGATGVNPISAAYFQKFYFEVGTGERTPAIDDRTTPLGTAVKYRETLPLSLCGQDFFDVMSELIRGRNRNSWFLIEKRGSDCIVRSYRISTKPDQVWLRNNNNVGVRAYSCGENHISFAAKYYSNELETEESESRLTNFECRTDDDVVKLNCPESNQDEKRLCEDETKNILLQAGSTQYFVTGGKMVILPADMTTSVTSTSILLSDVLGIKVFNGRNVIDIIPEGNAEIIFTGHLDDPNPTAESRLLVKAGKVITKINNQLVDYGLNRPQGTPESFRYSLRFDVNSLRSISESGKEESGVQKGVFGGITIISLRIVENLRTFGEFMMSSNKVFNLFPLTEGEAEVRFSDSYIMYTVTRAGMTLRDIARAQPGMSQLSGDGLANFMEQIRETSRLHYDDAEGGAIDQEFRGPRGWTASTQSGINTAFRAGDMVLIPTGRTFQGTAGNTLTVTDNVPRSRQNVEQRVQRRARRAMDDSLCTNLGGECQNNAIEDKVCDLANGKKGEYVKNKCLSNPSASYLCCLPPGAARRVPATTRSGVQCRQRGGQCSLVDERQAQDRVAIDRTCDETAKPMFAPNDPNKWSYYGTLDCFSSGDFLGVCCGSESGTTSTPSRAVTTPSTQSMASSPQCRNLGGTCVSIPFEYGRTDSDFEQFCGGRDYHGQKDCLQTLDRSGICCGSSSAASSTIPVVSSPPLTIPTQPSQAVVAPVRTQGTQCTSNNDCHNNDYPFCESGRCTNCVDRDQGSNARVASYVAVSSTQLTFPLFESTIDIDECKDTSLQNIYSKFLNEKVCTGKKFETAGAGHPDGGSDTIEIDCRRALNNPSAVCSHKMTSKGMAGYCEIPDWDTTPSSGQESSQPSEVRRPLY